MVTFRARVLIPASLQCKETAVRLTMGFMGVLENVHVMYVIAEFMIDNIVCYVILRALKWNSVIYTYSLM